MILVDTSAWIEWFRRRPQPASPPLFDLDEAVTCPPVVQEVLQGIATETAFRMAREAMLALPMIEAPIPIERFEEAAQIYRSGRRQGLTIRSGVDCLIAACALRHGLPVLHRDRDFVAIARIVPLDVLSL